MSEPQHPISEHLPENAYRELKPGESYVPMVPASCHAPEVTFRSILFGLAMNVLFAMAATYLALKVGQGIETAIPISILAVGLSGFLARMGYRRSSLLENVNILAISTTAGIVAQGTVFTLPAIYILKLDQALGMPSWALFLQIFGVPCLGAILGVVFLVPFRRYFVKQMHGRLPFPEATATNEILVTGSASSTGQAWVLIYSFMVGVVYNFASSAMKLFHEQFSTASIPLFHKLTHKIKAVFEVGTGAEFLGLGFIIGLRYAAIICAGSFMAWFVVIPLLAPFTLEQLQVLAPGIQGTSASDLFSAVPRNIGIGGIFTAGLLSIVKMSRVIVTALTQALGGLFRKDADSPSVDRTDEDISYPRLFAVGVLVTAVMTLFFRYGVMAEMPNPWSLTAISVILALGMSFLFTTVSAWAIAMISVTPISGMTVTTIIITAVILLAVGLPQSEAGMLATLLVGGVVASSLSMAGTLVTEFKIGYWLGASPKRIQWSAILACFLAAGLVTMTIMFLANTYGYDAATRPDTALAAPQANVMASALQGFIGGGDIPWRMYGIGVAMVLLVELVGISGLAFSLGMYLPMWLNTPILLGALVAECVRRSARDEATQKARTDRGVLIASGLIAGGAIIGVLISMLMALDDNWASVEIMNHLAVFKGVGEGTGNALGLIMFLGLCLWAFWNCTRAKPTATAPKD